jgi:spore photoproduct lyase
MIPVHLERILVEPEVAATPLVAAVRRNCGEVPVVEVVCGRAEEELRRLSLTEGKRVLLLKRFLGRSFKACQGLKPGYACCNLNTLAEANGCAMECTYCILQYYMTSPHLTVFANLDALQAEIGRSAAAQPRRILRIGTGELSDSLLLDPLTESTRHMVPFFRRLPNAVLELKTKTDNVANLEGLDHGERTVVAWSVNPPAVVAGEEHKTARLEDRLRAASRVAAWGYPVGFHLDPMICFQGWQDAYRELVEAILAAVPAERIAWISLGTLRFPPEMKPTMAARFPRSELRYGELIQAPDGKLRYLRPLRIEMYRHVAAHLSRRLDGARSAPIVYLCMEAPDVWRRVFDEPAPATAELEHRFAANFHRRFAEGSLPAPELAAYEDRAAGTAVSDAFVLLEPGDR